MRIHEMHKIKLEWEGAKYGYTDASQIYNWVCDKDVFERTEAIE
jgi:hypothetical protein